MNIAAHLGLGLAVTLSWGAATLDAAPRPPDKLTRQHFRCKQGGYTLKKCQKDIAVLKKVLQRYPVAQLGEWTWFLVASSDWKEFQRSHGLNPDSPAFTYYEGKQTFLEEALLTGQPTRYGELLLLWGMNMKNLLDFAVAHELGHALCNEKDEERARRAAKSLRDGVTPSCEIEFQASSPVAPVGPEMTISVHNYADVSSELLSAAENQAREIYRHAGLETVWLNCSPKLENIEPESCHFSDNTHLTLKISRRALNVQVRDRFDVLGTAYPDDNGVGYFAYIFYDRVQELAERQRLGHALLANVMAHEIGHLLLGSNSHSLSGIMSAHWTYDQLRNISEGTMWFIPAQSRMMRERLRDHLLLNAPIR
jgi:hypothetical protein